VNWTRRCRIVMAVREESGRFAVDKIAALLVACAPSR
jgi:hypothetical protein